MANPVDEAVFDSMRRTPLANNWRWVTVREAVDKVGKELSLQLRNREGECYGHVKFCPLYWPKYELLAGTYLRDAIYHLSYDLASQGQEGDRPRVYFNFNSKPLLVEPGCTVLDIALGWGLQEEGSENPLQVGPTSTPENILSDTRPPGFGPVCAPTAELAPGTKARLVATNDRSRIIDLD